MFSLNEDFRYFLYPRYIGLNKGVESLCELLYGLEGCDPLSGDVFLFFGKKRKVAMMLRWDKDGFILYRKALEEGSFELPRFQPDKGLSELPYETFFMMMRGVPLRAAHLRKRFRI